jgi:hypothetical protein
MSDIRDMTRREFSLEAAMAILSGVAITISGCGGGGSNPAGPSGNPPVASNGDHVGAISANHGHVAKITAVDISTGKGFALDIKGTATHTHTVTLSDADIAAVGANQQVAHQSSSGGGHTHTVTFN